MSVIRLSSLSLSLLAALTLAACVDDPAELGPDLGTAEAALSCSGSSCDGLPAYSTSCVIDGYVVADGRVFAGGVQIGGLALFYSPSCQAVYTSSGFYQPRNHSTCAARITLRGNGALCASYTGSLGNVSPLRYVPLGQSAFGSVTLTDGSGVSAATGWFTRTL